MSMTAEAEYAARTEAEEDHAAAILLLLLLESRTIADQIRRGQPYIIESGKLYDALLAAGQSGAQIIADNAITPAEVVALLRKTGFIEAAARLSADQMTDTTRRRVEQAINALPTADNPTPSDREKALAVKAELDAIAANRAAVSAGNMVVDGAEGLKNAIVNSGTKTWVNMGDRRVRVTHMAAGGQQVAAAGFFSVGGALMRFPRDPAAPAKETARCRCVARYSQEW